MSDNEQSGSGSDLENHVTYEGSAQDSQFETDTQDSPLDLPHESLESSQQQHASSSSDLIPSLSSDAPGGRPRINSAQWRREGIDVVLPTFTDVPGRINPESTEDVSGSHVIDILFTKDLLSRIRIMSNRRAHQELGRAGSSKTLEGWRDISEAEIYGFLAIVIFMGVVQLPSERDYWSESILGQGIVKKTMSRNRFFQIKHCLSVADPSAEQIANDRIAKVRPFLDEINTISRSRYQLPQDLSLDESQAQCGHRYARCSYRGETKKPIADYIKIISLHCALTSYCYAFHVDTRTETTREMVLELCGKLPHKPYRIATDRFYTSVATAKELLARGFYMYGTVRTDRGVCKALEIPPLTEGESRWAMAPPQLLSCVWKDSVNVWFLSTCHDGRSAGGTVERRKRGQPRTTRPAPQVAIDYNLFMGGCDRANSLRSSYNTYLSHQRRWCLSLFYYGIDVLLVNALIYHNDPLPPACKQSQKDFRMSIIECFVGRSFSRSNRPESRKRAERTPPNILPPARLIGQHSLQRRETQRYCGWCYKTQGGRQSKTSYCCPTCDVALHAECFSRWHDPNGSL